MLLAREIAAVPPEDAHGARRADRLIDAGVDRLELRSGGVGQSLRARRAHGGKCTSASAPKSGGTARAGARPHAKAARLASVRKLGGSGGGSGGACLSVSVR